MPVDAIERSVRRRQAAAQGVEDDLMRQGIRVRTCRNLITAFVHAVEEDAARGAKIVLEELGALEGSLNRLEGAVQEEQAMREEV